MIDDSVQPAGGIAVPSLSDQPVGVGESIAWKGLWLSLGLLLLAFAPTLAWTVGIWWSDPEYSHGFLMPFLAWWLLRQRKERIATLAGGTSILAVPALILCLLVRTTAELNFMISLSPYAFVGALGAVLLAFLGWRGLSAFMPALVALLLACPLPGPVQDMLTLPLRSISAQLAVGLLHISGIPTYLDGNIIHLHGTDSLWIADACSGIRSFISLVSIAVVACLVWQRNVVLKLLVVLAAVPIAILANGIRIWLTGWLSVHVGQEAAEGAFHFFEGFALFALAGVMLLGFAALLGVFFPRSEE